MFGFTTTMSPLEINRFIPPIPSIAVFTIFEGWLPFATTITGGPFPDIRKSFMEIIDSFAGSVSIRLCKRIAPPDTAPIAIPAFAVLFKKSLLFIILSIIRIYFIIY